MQKEERKETVIPANRGYIGFLAAALTAVGVLGMIYSILESRVPLSTRLVFGIGGGVLLLTAVCAWYMLFVKVTIRNIDFTVKLIKERTVAAADIEYVEWSWFYAQPGNCYVNLKNGTMVLLQRKLFNKALREELVLFCESNHVNQRGLDADKKKQK